MIIIIIQVATPSRGGSRRGQRSDIKMRSQFMGPAVFIHTGVCVWCVCVCVCKRVCTCACRVVSMCVCIYVRVVV